MGASRTVTCWTAAAAVIWLSCGAAPAAAQGVEMLDTTFKDWMTKNNVHSGVLAVSHEKRLVLSEGYGGTHPNGAVLLASLSKAITAVCAATLIDAGKLGFETRLGDIPDYFRRNGEPAEARIKDVNIAQLMAHRAGFDRTSDPVTKALADLLATNTPRQPVIDRLLSRALRAKPARAPGEAYAYSNMAYLMLGAVIEASSGKPYEQYCNEAVLQPLGLVGATLDPEWRILSAFGGWKLSGPQYLRFLEAFAPDSKILGPKSQAFMADGTDKWMNEKKEVYYSLGVLVRPGNSGGRNVWHSGEWRYNLRNSVNMLSANLGTYGVRLGRGVSWFAQYMPHPGDAAVGELDRTINRAIGAIKTWPSGDLYTNAAK